MDNTVYEMGIISKWVIPFRLRHFYCPIVAVCFFFQATTAPTIKSNTFRGVKTNDTLTVPSGSSCYDAWIGTSNYYLGLYNWTKV